MGDIRNQMALRSRYFPFPPLFSFISSLKIFFNSLFSHTLNLYSSLKTKTDYHPPIKTRDMLNGFYALFFTSSGREGKENGGKNSKLSYFFLLSFINTQSASPSRILVEKPQDKA
jgi:hypothetical protein